MDLPGLQRGVSIIAVLLFCARGYGRVLAGLGRRDRQQRVFVWQWVHSQPTYLEGRHRSTRGTTGGRILGDSELGVTPQQEGERAPAERDQRGQSYVTGLIDAVMHGPDWNSTAIFLASDDWGAFYDHVVPPKIDQNGYGLRVPGLVISPFARAGYIDHQTLSFDAYLKFIEDDFLNGQRLDPRTDGRPDPRTDVRENTPTLGNLTNDFNFDQQARPPIILPIHPETTLAGRAGRR